MAAPILKNRAGVACATTGTGTVTLGAALGAVPPNLATWQTFASAGVANAQVVRYLILDSNGAWEYGTGTYTTVGTTLTRTLGASSTGALLNLSGSAQVFIAGIGEDIVPYDSTNTQITANLTPCTGLPISTGVSGLGAGIATFLGVPSSANLLAAMTDETGTGTLVFSASPTLSGTIGGTLTFSGALTFSSAMTYGGVALSNSVTGTGSMVLSASPTFTGTITAAAANFSGGTINFTAANVGLEIGAVGSANTPFVDFHSSASATDYDVRLISSGGTASVGAGTLTVNAAALAVAAAETVTSASATALTVGRQGATNPALQVDASTATSLTGVLVKSANAAAGVAMSAISSGTNENFTLDAKGSGTITLGGTSTGNIVLSRKTTMVGTATNDNAAAGQVGEYISATTGSVALTSTVAANVCSMSLTAGDWDVSGGCQVVSGGPSTTYDITLGPTSATLTSRLDGGEVFDTSPPPFWCVALATVRFSLASTTTVYLVCRSTHAVAMSVGGAIQARRVR